MKISDDQNTVKMDDGTVGAFTDGVDMCERCVAFNCSADECWDIPCCFSDSDVGCRRDERVGYFKEVASE